jgi:SAM-dependent methyltransferase
VSVDDRHWETVWLRRPATEMSWFEEEPAVSLELVRRYATDHASRIIDVGGGASRLVDRLLAAGFEDVTVLDIAPAGLSLSRERLGADASKVRWIVSDVRHARFSDTFDLWHDRAVFHFLTDRDDRREYVATMSEAVRSDGCAIVATFAEDGPPSCSGLPVARYSAGSLSQALAPAFAPLDFVDIVHTTPAGHEQPFVYGVFSRAHGIRDIPK